MTINLLPWRENIAAQRTRRYVLLLITSLVTLNLLTFGLHYFLNQLKVDYQSRNIHLTEKFNDTHIPGNIKKLSNNYQIASKQIKLIQTIHLNQSNFWREFAFLQKKLPEDIQLTHLTWLGNELRLQGTAIQSEHIGSLIKSLEISHFFSKVILESIDKENHEAIIHFTIHSNRIEDPLA